MKQQILSITEHIYAVLRADLISCRIRPGERLRTNELGKRFNASLGAVREALVRLAGDGLAIADPRRGFSAAPISSTDLRALSDASIGVEAMCIEASLRAGDQEWEHNLRAAYEVIEMTPLSASDFPDRISAAFTLAHKQFHDSLIAACHNPWLLRMRRSLDIQSERYRQICLPLEPTHNHSSGYQEMLGAALARDTGQTVALVATRYRTNAERFAKTLEQKGKETRFWADQLVAI
jgi:DNA-binding GntR family transcriptional regulator